MSVRKTFNRRHVRYVVDSFHVLEPFETIENRLRRKAGDWPAYVVDAALAYARSYQTGQIKVYRRYS